MRIFYIFVFSLIFLISPTQAKEISIEEKLSVAQAQIEVLLRMNRLQQLELEKLNIAKELTTVQEKYKIKTDELRKKLKKDSTCQLNNLQEFECPKNP